MLAPHLDRIAQEGVGKLLVAKVDSDRAPELSRTYHVTGLPTLILFRGGSETGRVVGMDPQGIQNLVEGALQ
jgi:thioredoxin-like negative regulator of GroEL